MSKALTTKSNSLTLGDAQNINNKANSGIFCSNCYSYIFINIFIKSDQIFVKAKCENEHVEYKLLSNFMNSYRKNYIKACQICYSYININDLYYCYSCSSKNIICMECKNKYHSENSIKNGKNHITVPLTMKCKYCPLHNRINTCYCTFCKEYLCQFDYKKEHFCHAVLNLDLTKIIMFKNKAKSIIEKEEKENKEEIQKINNIIIKIRNKLKEILNYKINVIYLKRNIINSYKLSMWNYNNTKNIKFVRKHFNEKNVTSILSKIYNSSGLRDKHLKSNNNKNNNIKRNKSYLENRKKLK